MNIIHREIGVCGLSCLLCPNYQTEAKSRCTGCKSEARMAVGCPFITCAVKKKGIEFCWDCSESKTCDKWRKHRSCGKKLDSFKCYQTLEDDISFIITNGIDKFVDEQKAREKLLAHMLREFNEGRSKSYYCIAATILTIDELTKTINKVGKESKGHCIKAKAKLMHQAIDDIANRNGYYLKLRR